MILDGAMGTMTGFAYPEILKSIHTRYMSGDVEGATQEFYKYCPLIRFENQPGVGLTLRKHVYTMRGALSCAQARAPFIPLDNETLADLDDLVSRLDLTGK